MTDDPTGTTKPADAQDELDRLQQMHERLKEEQNAWRNLLEGLADLKNNEAPQQPTVTREP
ncbi:MAG: hypothetical protein ACO1NQ_06845 [Flavobacteriales bacterium]